MDNFDIPELHRFVNADESLSSQLWGLSAQLYAETVSELGNPALGVDFNPTFPELFVEGMESDQIWAQLETAGAELAAVLEPIAAEAEAVAGSDYSDIAAEPESDSVLEEDGAPEIVDYSDAESEAESLVEDAPAVDAPAAEDDDAPQDSAMDSELAAVLGDDDLKGIPGDWMGFDDDLAQYGANDNADASDSDVDFGAALGGRAGSDDEDGEENEDGLVDDDDDNHGLGETAHARAVAARAADVKEHEEAIMAEKEWYMKGEAAARDREADALLDADGMVFDRGTRAPPPLNSAWTLKLEAMLRKRIEESRFDDPVRLAKPAPDSKAARDAELAAAAARLGQKSALSLAEIYEAQHRDAEALRRGALTEAEKRLELLRAAAREAFTLVCNELDTLANMSYTPAASAATALEGEGDVRVLRAAAAGVSALDTEVSAPIAGTYAAPAEGASKRRGGADSVATAAERTVAERRAERSRKLRQKHRASAERHAELAATERLAESGPASAASTRALQLAAQRKLARGALANVQTAEVGDRTNWHKGAARAFDAARATAEE